MSTAETLLLGAIAGSTIFLGLPIGRMQGVSAGTKAFLAATATGILVFLFWDVMSQVVDPIEGALTAGHDGRFLWLALLLLAGFSVGLMSLVYYDLWMKRRRRQAFLGPGAASTAEFEQEHEHHFTGMSPARWLATFIAVGIGLHNFSEGLAIGQASASDQLSLALVLIIGFGLHNATEGLGICSQLARSADYSQVFVGPDRFGREAGGAQPRELVVQTVGPVVDAVDRRDDVLFLLGNDDVREHERAARLEDAGDAAEEVLLARAVEVMDGERGDHEVERAVRQRILEAREAQVDLRDDAARSRASSRTRFRTRSSRARWWRSASGTRSDAVW